MSGSPWVTDFDFLPVDTGEVRPQSCLMTIGQGGSDRTGAADASIDSDSVPASPIEFRLDPSSGVPTYLQLVHQVEGTAPVLGTSRSGTSCPRSGTWWRRWRSTRTRYPRPLRELETKGLIVGRPGQGTFILATLGQVALPDLTGLRRSLRGWLAKADTAGLDRAGSRRLSPVSCGISMSAAAVRVPAAASRRGLHERHRGDALAPALRRRSGIPRVLRSLYPKDT